MVDVYLPKKGISGRMDADEIVLHALPDNVEVLHLMEHELTQQIIHLDRSNTEMMEFDPEGEDMDLTEACLENATLVMEKQQKLEDVKRKIDTIGCNCAKHSHSLNVDHLVAHNVTALNRQQNISHDHNAVATDSTDTPSATTATASVSHGESLDAPEGMDLNERYNVSA